MIFQYKVETKDKETKPDLQRSLIDSQSIENPSRHFQKAKCASRCPLRLRHYENFAFITLLVGAIQMIVVIKLQIMLFTDDVFGAPALEIRDCIMIEG